MTNNDKIFRDGVDNGKAMMLKSTVVAMTYIIKLVRPDQFNFSKHGRDRTSFRRNKNKIKRRTIFFKKNNSNDINVRSFNFKMFFNSKIK